MLNTKSLALRCNTISAILCRMSTAALEKNPASTLEKLDGIATEYVEQWLNHCYGFMRWHRENILAREPSAEDSKANEQVLPWLIRCTRMMHAQMLDPAWPHQDLAKRVEVALWQLQERWSLTHITMTEAEADAILREVFPGHASGT